MEKIDNKYEVGDWLIYPKHGLGKAIDYEVQTILKKKTEFLVVFFEQERMTLRIPIDKMNELGLRSISGKDEMKKASNNEEEIVVHRFAQGTLDDRETDPKGLEILQTALPS